MLRSDRRQLRPRRRGSDRASLAAPGCETALPTPSPRTAATVLTALALLAAVALPARAADITVCPSGCDHASIGAALSAAEAGDVIRLRGGITYTENVIIAKGITIEGPFEPEGPATVAGLGTSSTISIETPNPVTLRNLKVTGGTGTVISEDAYGGGVYINHADAKVTIAASWIYSNTVRGDGGGIYVDAGRLDLVDSVVSHNVATLNGGGVFNDEGGLLNVEGTTFHDNVAAYIADPDSTLSNGGGLFNRDRATVAGAILRDNEATTSGGGIMNRGRGELTIQDTFVDGNHSLDGGGIYNANELTMEGGSLNGNSAGEFGGGMSTIGIATLTDVAIDDNESPAGGGIYVRAGIASGQDGELTISRCSMVGNTALTEPGRGAAVFVERDGDLTLELCTISGNDALRGSALSEAGGRIEVSHSTIVANRVSGPDAAVIDPGGPASIRFGNTFIHNPGVTNCSERNASLGHNLDGDESCGLTRTGDLTPRTVTIEPLADNGGTTRTHALPAGSPAIDAGHPGLCIDHDQRGYPAPIDGNGDGTALCDIGAFEYGSGPDAPTAAPSPGPGTGTPEPTPTTTTGDGIRIFMPFARR